MCNMDHNIVKRLLKNVNALIAELQQISNTCTAENKITITNELNELLCEQKELTSILQAK